MHRDVKSAFESLQHAKKLVERAHAGRQNASITDIDPHALPDAIEMIEALMDRVGAFNAAVQEMQEAEPNAKAGKTKDWSNAIDVLYSLKGEPWSPDRLK
mgnify:CR=1 FL=1